jgi:hypothetical protein
METNDELKGKEARLPDGQRVVIEEVEDGQATVRRLDGDRAGTVAVCDVEKLTIDLAS